MLAHSHKIGLFTSNQNQGGGEIQNLILNPTRFSRSLWLGLQNIVQVEKILKCIKTSWSIVGVKRFTDFDDTLYSRSPQLSEDRFEKNRWKDWNDLVEHTIWFDNFFQKYYTPEMVVWDVLQQTDIILTAGRPTVQNGKMRYTSTNSIESIIVDEHKVKPRAILNWVLENKIFPEEVVFSDDKAFALLEEFKDLSELLWNRIVLQNVVLSKDRINQVEKIDTITIHNWNIIQ